MDIPPTEAFMAHKLNREASAATAIVHDERSLLAMAADIASPGLVLSIFILLWGVAVASIAVIARG